MMVIEWIFIVYIMFIWCFIKLVFFYDGWVDMVDIDCDMFVKDVYFFILKFILDFWVFIVSCDFFV